jgi:hypothetical protein
MFYGRLLEIGLQILKSVKSLHQDAKLIHGCIGPNSVALQENGMFRFQACVRSALIESGEVIPLVLDGKCPHFYQREFISPWIAAIPSVVDDLWATMTFMNWLGCSDHQFGIPATVTDADAVREMKFFMMKNSWECEIHGVDNPDTRAALAELRRSMWEAINGPNPYDTIRALMRQSLDLLGEFSETLDDPTGS